MSGDRTTPGLAGQAATRHAIGRASAPSPLSVLITRGVGLSGAALVAFALLWGRQPPAPHPSPRGGRRLTEIGGRLAAAKPVDVTAERAVEYSRSYLRRAEKANRSGKPFAADRLAEAADALLHIAEHQQHLRAGGGLGGPRGAADVQEHLQRVYFRTQQADYFLKQSHDPQASTFPKWARDFRQLALRAYERNDMAAADENAACADEVVKALENLAQAAAPVEVPPPPPQ